ncbi:MAG: hypothetical protein ACFFFG_05035 [Candidatus Thorarchaeota archaeon]
MPQLIAFMSQTDSEAEYFILLFFLMLPVMGTTLVGITTFINEIRWKTIKPLLAAPVSEGIILLGKSLACIIAGVMIDGILSLIILFSGLPFHLSRVLLLFVVGPLSVVFTTFLFILGTSKLPSIVESGGVVLLPMGGLLIIFGMFFLLKGVFQFDTVIAYLLLSVGLLMAIFVTFFLAQRLFDRETLVLAV